MADKYSIEISLSNDTLQALGDQDLSLSAFKGVQTTAGGGRSTVWLNTNNFADTVTIEWEEQYGGFTDKDQELESGIEVDAKNIKEMDLGDLLTVKDNGVPEVTAAGRKGDIVVQNLGKKAWTCGMGQVVTGPDGKSALSPLCAFPLNGHFSVLMMPYEKILLMFESGQTDTGSVVEESTSSTIIITLTGADVGKPKQVSFDINDGWDAKKAAWAKISDNGYVLAKELIHKM